MKMKMHILNVMMVLAVTAGGLCGQTAGQIVIQKRKASGPGYEALAATPSNSAAVSIDGSGNLVFKPWSELGGAPADLPYIVSTPQSGLSNEVALSALSSGLMRVETTTGAITSITTSAGVADNLSDETGTGALTFGTAPVFTTRITLPNAAAPTTSSVGQMAVDNNAWGSSRGAIQVHDGTSATYVVATLTSSTPSDTYSPRWTTGGTVVWGKTGIYGPITFAATGSQTLTTGEEYLDPTGFFYADGVTDGASVGGTGLGYISHINVGLKCENVTTAGSTTVTITVKNGAGSVIGGTVYYLGELSAYTGPEVRVPLMIYQADAVTSAIKVYAKLDSGLSSGSVNVVNLEAVSHNVVK